MANIIATDKQTVILGLGKTGVSVARFLVAKGQQFVVVDSRTDPPGLEELVQITPAVKVVLGPFNEAVEGLLASAAEIIISPGLSRSIPQLQKALAHGVPVIGDIALFLREVHAPVIGITGSNGKTTVTTLVGLIAQAAGIRVAVAGNIGVPALDVIDAEVELYVLELSSFQLESIPCANLQVACLLNVSEDHMDRYASLAQYCAAKQRIFWGAKHAVYNLDDKLTQPPIAENVHRYGFALAQKQELGEKKYYWDRSTTFLRDDQAALISSGELNMFGRHNIANALAVYAICDAARIDRRAVNSVLREFRGLPHRCEWVAEFQQITFINDSKATNVGAAVAAIHGMTDSFAHMTLIVGGDGKGADFAEFAAVINQSVSVLILIGRDAPVISALVDESVEKYHAATMKEAVRLSMRHSRPGSVVLLSPACASFDMFSGYEERGAKFIAAVKELTA